MERALRGERVESNRRWMHPRALIGVLILLLGLFLLADNLDLLDFGSIFGLWPLLLILWGLPMVIGSFGRLTRLFGAFLTVMGLVLFLGHLGVLNINLGDVWPLILIFFGVAILLAGRNVDVVGAKDEASSEGFIKRFVMLGGLELRSDTPDLRGGDLTSIMAGIDLDLQDAAMKQEEVVIHTFTLMGGIEIKVPPDWEVVSDVVILLGAMEDGRRARPEGATPPTHRLVLRGIAIMGGIELTS
jgi:predicted membrane protein